MCKEMCKSYTVINNAIIHQQIENGEHWTSTRTPTDQHFTRPHGELAAADFEITLKFSDALLQPLGAVASIDST